MKSPVTDADGNLEFFTLSWSPATSDNFTEFARGTTEVVSSLLDTFDPTLLSNDTYDIRVFAQDISGNTSEYIFQLGVEANARIGNFTLDFTDLVVPLAGIPIEISRTYDTLNANTIGDFGYGWNLSGYQPHIRETVPIHPFEVHEDGTPCPTFAAYPFEFSDRVYLTNPSGRRVGFTFEPIPEPCLLGTIWRPYFRPDFGVFDRLEVKDVALQQRPDGTFELYAFGFDYNPMDYTLITPDGTRYAFNQFRGIDSITDRNGNTLSFSETGIVSSTGASITFVRDELGRITEIVDPAGNSLTYAYDDQGNLIAVTDQEQQVRTCEYDDPNNHLLTAVINNAGQLEVAASLDDGNRLEGLANPAGSQSFTHNLDSFTEVIHDEFGNPITLVYDARGNVLSETDQLGHTVSYTYDSADNETSITNQLGETTFFDYDGLGNVTRIEAPLNNVTTRVEKGAGPFPRVALIRI